MTELLNNNPPVSNQMHNVKQGITEQGWLTDSWYFLAPSAALKKGTQKRYIILGQPIVAGRTKSGEVFALRDICPHRLVPLSAGTQRDEMGETRLQCPYHGWQFGTHDGVCKHMPSIVDNEIADISRVKVWSYSTHEESGAVYVYIAHARRGTPDICLPPPDFGDLPKRPKLIVERVFNAHMDDAVVGLMDPAHVAFVHNQWWWRPPSVGLKEKTKAFEPRERGWAICKHRPSSNSLLYRWIFGGDVETEIVFQLPGYRWEIISNAKARLLTLTCLTPISEKETRITQFTWWRGAPLLNAILPIAKPAVGHFLDQDGAMVNLQNEGMKYHKSMMWIDDIDVQAKWYQTLKRAWTKARTDQVDFINPILPRTLRWRS